MRRLRWLRHMNSSQKVMACQLLPHLTLVAEKVAGVKLSILDIHCFSDYDEPQYKEYLVNFKSLCLKKSIQISKSCHLKGRLFEKWISFYALSKALFLYESMYAMAIEKFLYLS
jgi:hypothetical protein